MGGKGETVMYTRMFERGPNEGPLTDAQKKDLKDRINRIINDATVAITIDVMVAPKD